MTNIIGIKLAQRLENSQPFQEIITKYGCNIKTRIGLHNTTPVKCDNYGIVLLEVVDNNVVHYLQNDLLDIDGIEMQIMKFN